MKNIPKTTLFLIQSLDGKISSGDTDQLDVDHDWNMIPGVKEGLPQYYALEQETDLVSFNTGRVMAKIGINTRKTVPAPISVRFVLVDNAAHINKKGLTYLSRWVKHTYIVTTNKQHPALMAQKTLSNISVIWYKNKINFVDLFQKLKIDYRVTRMTIQSGGTMNATLVRAGLVDRVSIVIAPLLVGGATTPTLMDGEAIHSVKQLSKLKVLKLISVRKLKYSYLHVVYKVHNFS